MHLFTVFTDIVFGSNSSKKEPLCVLSPFMFTVIYGRCSECMWVVLKIKLSDIKQYNVTHTGCLRNVTKLRCINRIKWGLVDNKTICNLVHITLYKMQIFQIKTYGFSNTNPDSLQINHDSCDSKHFFFLSGVALMRLSALMRSIHTNNDLITSILFVRRLQATDNCR